MSMSRMREAIQDYLDTRRSFGFKLSAHGHQLSEFAAFLEARHATFITTELAISWAKQNPQLHPSTWAQRLAAVRGFARYFSTIDNRTQVPPLGLIPGRVQRKPPHIYTDQEIVQLMQAARQLLPPNGTRAEDALRPLSFATAFGLFATTGLRLSEVLNLHREAVDLQRALLTVYRTKFGKTRIVPLHKTTVAALQQYAERRDRLHPAPQTPHFFVGQRGRPLDKRAFKADFLRLSRQVGLRGSTDRHGPRIHDLRHTFAVKTLIRWYQDGVDVERRLPRLSTYLGHTHVSDTYWYLSADPRLLALAGKRLERVLEGII